MITQERLKELLHYDPDTGVFTWLVNRGSAKAGCEAGCIVQYKTNHYRQLWANGYRSYAHRLAWLYVHGEFPDNHIDHIDGDGLNNRISNLRDVSRRDNQRNMRRSSRNTSGFTGVSRDRTGLMWMASIGTESGTKHLGCFAIIEDAVEARKLAEKELGYHKNHGRES